MCFGSKRKTEQVLDDGSIVTDFDETLSTASIFKLYCSLFGSAVKVDRNQVLIGDKVALLSANITYLGGYWEPYKKRWQLKSYYPDYVKENEKKHIKTFFVGIYSFRGLHVFVINDPVSHVGKKVHNSSSHIHVFDLQYALKNGSFRKVDKGGNLLIVLNQTNFVSYINGAVSGKTDFSAEYCDSILCYFDHFFESIKSRWSGVECYKEMVSAHDNNAIQPEWCGFYFEYLFKRYLITHPTDDISWCSDKKETGIDLDLKFPKTSWFFGDLKSDSIDSDILGNDQKTLNTVLTDNNGKIWYVTVRFSGEKDSAHGYEVTKYWDHLRGDVYAKNNYIDMASRYGKKMKYSIRIKEAQILNLDQAVYEILKMHPFSQGKNSDNKARDPKIKINDEVAEAISIYTKSF